MHVAGRHFATGEPVTVELSGTRVVAINTVSEAPADLPWIAPGLVDLQVNGFHGQEFNDPELDVDRVEAVCRALDGVGVTRFLPTATTQSYDFLMKVFGVLADAVERSEHVRGRVPGFHLEGPYLSPEDGPRGAHPRAHCRAPDWEEFQRLQESARGLIRLVTLSPEYPEACAFIARAVETGVRIAVGHTAADSDQIRAAVDAGARLSTHLGNGAHGVLPRHPNYLWDQLAEDRLHASLIADGHHLPPEVVRVFVRAKTPTRCILVSDVTGLGGMPPGRYDSPGLGAVEVLEDGKLVVAGQRRYLAGAARPLSTGIAAVMEYAGLDLKTAVELASVQPARFMGWDAGLVPDGRADLVLFRLRQEGPLAERWQPVKTVTNGTVTFDAG